MDSEINDKLPPQDIEAEQATLGAVLWENDRLPQIEEVIVHPRMLYKKNHQIVWEAMKELYQKAEPIKVCKFSELSVTACPQTDKEVG